MITKPADYWAQCITTILEASYKELTWYILDLLGNVSEARRIVPYIGDYIQVADDTVEIPFTTIPTGFCPINSDTWGRLDTNLQEFTFSNHESILFPHNLPGEFIRTTNSVCKMTYIIFLA